MANRHARVDGGWSGAVLASALIHVGIVVFLFLAMLNCERFNKALTAMGIPEWGHLECQKPIVMPGPVIEAALVGPTAAPRSGSRATTPPKPAAVEPPKPEPPKPEPPKPETKPAVAPRPEPAPEPPKPKQTPPKPEPKPEPVKPAPAPTPTKPDTTEQDRVAALAAEQAREKKEQEAKRKVEQILLEEQQREAAEQAKIEKQLADIRKEREAAEKRLNREKQRAEQLADVARDAQRKAAESASAATQQRGAGEPGPTAEQEAAKAMTGANGQDNGLAARYAAAIQGAVTQSWNRPDNAPGGLRCTLRIVQIPGGEVISAQVTSPCNADAATRTSIEQAVMKASPLPYQGYEPVFQRSVNFNFRYDG